MRHRLGIGIALGTGLLLGVGLSRGCMSVPSEFNVTVNLSDEDRERIDTLNTSLKHLTKATDKTLELFGVPVDNAPAEDD